MKNLIVLKNRKMLSIFFSIITIFQNVNAQTDTTTFDVKIFQDELSKQMKFTFPYMDLDTNLYPVLYASSQVEAGSPACYGTHKGFYMNAVGSEKEAAVLAVRKYKEYLINKIFLKESSIKNCRFNKYCCIAVIENGLVHIEFVIDNEIKLWEMVMDEEYDDFY